MLAIQTGSDIINERWGAAQKTNTNGALEKRLTHMPFTHTFTGSNPVRVTIWNQPADQMICRFSLAGPMHGRTGRTAEIRLCFFFLFCQWIQRVWQSAAFQSLCPHAWTTDAFESFKSVWKQTGSELNPAYRSSADKTDQTQGAQRAVHWIPRRLLTVWSGPALDVLRLAVYWPKIFRLHFLFPDLPERGKFKSESDIAKWPDNFWFSISKIRIPVSIGYLSLDSGWLWW